MAAKKRAAAKRSAKKAPEPDPVVEEGVAAVDDSHERNLKVDELQGVEHGPDPAEGNDRDESQERNEKVDEIVTREVDEGEPASEHSEDLPVDNRTTRDGAREGEDVDLPVVRVGELWESMAESDDDRSGGRRRVRVVDVDEDGKVRVENLVTRRVSHIDRDRFRPPFWNRQFS